MSDAYYECEITGEITPKDELIPIRIFALSYKSQEGICQSEKETKYIKKDEYPGDEEKALFGVHIYTLPESIAMIKYSGDINITEPQNIHTAERKMWENIAL